MDASKKPDLREALDIAQQVHEEIYDTALAYNQGQGRINDAHGKAPRPTRKLRMKQVIIPADEARIAWVSRARCRSIDPDKLFVRGAAQKKTAAICRRCPVIVECAVEALDNQVEFGVWGGMTERERRALLRRHPEVVSWAELFAAQRKNRTARLAAIQNDEQTGQIEFTSETANHAQPSARIIHPCNGIHRR
jgi:WhiB family transcriptional regulator, redox-sensing transcriptional regulator